MERHLTLRQYDFAIEYVKNGCNAYQAALSAGYSMNFARMKAYKLPQHPAIQMQLSKIHEKSETNLVITFDWKVDKLVQIIERAKAANQHLTVIKAIAELNKMQGDYAPNKVMKLTVDATKKKLAEARQVYKEY